MLSRNGGSLAMAAFGLAAGGILTIAFVPAPQNRLAAPVMAAVSPASSSPTSAVAPPSSEATEAGPIDPPATRITEAYVKRDVRRAFKGPARFGKFSQGNGTSGRFSICGDVTTTRNVFCTLRIPERS